MLPKFLKIALIFCLSVTLVYGQKKAGNTPYKKKGMFSLSVNYSDYGFVKAVKDSSISYAFNRKGLFKSGNSSFGFGVSYWKGLGSHVDFSGNFIGTFSNFPKLFVKNDSIGRSSFTPQLDLLLHARALRENKVINPFLTAGIGAGYFGKQLVVYAPLGVGLQFNFRTGTYVFLQAQWKLALTDGIRDDFMFYSLGFGRQKKPKKPENKTTLPATDSAKKDVINEPVAVVPAKDTDGDGIPDKDDKCVDVKGVAKYNGCPVPDTDGDGVNDDEDLCKTVKGLKENGGCPVDDPKIIEELAAKEKAVNKPKISSGSINDRDKDGIPDNIDQCPDVAGIAKNIGCPAVEIKTVNDVHPVRKTENSETYIIYFEFDKSSVAKNESTLVLDKVMQLLNADKSLKLKIDGHSDSSMLRPCTLEMRIKYNYLKSEERAKNALKYLTSPGNKNRISETRITTTPYGLTRPDPVYKYETYNNRRVELTIQK